MKESSATHHDIFDVRKIRRLVEMMKDHDLSEIDLQQGEVSYPVTASPAGGSSRSAAAAAAADCGRRRAGEARTGGPAETGRRNDDQQPDGGHVLRRVRSRIAPVCQGRRTMSDPTRLSASSRR